MELAALIGLGLGGVFMLIRGRRIAARSHAQPIEQGTYAAPTDADEVAELIDSFPEPLPNTRGFRNNNPGNIEYSPANDWDGQTGSDGRYAIFSDIRYGIRALGKLLDAYYYRHGLTTVAGIINRWAPAHENNTESYISHVAASAGVSPHATINLEAIKPQLVAAIIRHENGHDLPAGLIEEGLAL